MTSGEDREPLLNANAALGDAFASSNSIQLVQVGKRLNHRLDFLIPVVLRSKRHVTLTLHLRELELEMRKQRFFRGTVKIKRVSLLDVAEVRAGAWTMNFQRWGSKLVPELCFSVHYRYFSKTRGRKRDKIANFFVEGGTVGDRDAIVEHLQRIVNDAKQGRLRHAAHRVFRQTNSRAAFWENMIQAQDTNRDGRIDLKELKSFLSTLGLTRDSDVIADELLKKYCDDPSMQSLKPETFSHVLWKLKLNKQIVQVYADCFRFSLGQFDEPDKPQGLVRFAGLKEFLCQVQMEEETRAEELAHEVLNKYGFLYEEGEEKDKEDAKPKEEGNPEQSATAEQGEEKGQEEEEKEKEMMLDFAGFHDFMTHSRENSALRFPQAGVADLDQPLCNYFVSSSHNTYLRGDQLMGSAGVAAYVAAYDKGFRCIEVDLWDGRNGKPIITHGMTATESMPFDSFVAATFSQAYALGQESPPIIISLENHAGDTQQKYAAELLMSTFGERIMKRAEPRLNTLPSLKECYGKLLVKASFEQVTEETLRSLCLLQIEKFLGDDGWDEMIQRPADSVLNISENAFRAVQHKDKLSRFAQTHIVRVYPFGLRIDSSNLDPLICWECGVQIASLNIQKQDRKNTRNFTMFDQKVGYSLKPTQFDLKLTLDVKVLMGYLLPECAKTNSVKIQVRVVDYSMLKISSEVQEGEEEVPSEEEEKRFETGEVRNNTFDPEFGQEFRIETSSAATTLLLFYCKDGNKTVAVGGAPILDIRPGYRAVPLVKADLTQCTNDSCVLIHSQQV